MFLGLEIFLRAWIWVCRIVAGNGVDAAFKDGEDYMAGIPTQSARAPSFEPSIGIYSHAAAASRTYAAPSILRLHQLLVACVVSGGDRSAGLLEPPLAGFGMADAFVLRV
jgi:hypothetical protein